VNGFWTSLGASDGHPEGDDVEQEGKNGWNVTGGFSPGSNLKVVEGQAMSEVMGEDIMDGVTIGCLIFYGI
jgi:hypothetical protein